MSNKDPESGMATLPSRLSLTVLPPYLPGPAAMTAAATLPMSAVVHQAVCDTTWTPTKMPLGTVRRAPRHPKKNYLHAAAI